MTDRKLKIGILAVALISFVCSGCISENSGLIGNTESPLSSVPSNYQPVSLSYVHKDRKPVHRLGINENILKYVNNAPGVVIVDFYADWCGPCRKQGKIFDGLHQSIKAKNGTVIKVNVDEHEALAEQFKVQSLPTLIVIKDAKIIERHLGVADNTKISKFLNR